MQLAHCEMLIPYAESVSLVTALLLGMGMMDICMHRFYVSMRISVQCVHIMFWLC